MDGALRERERADGLDERVAGVRAAVQPGHAEVAGRLERDLVLRAADLEDDVDRDALRHPLQRDRDRRHDGLVADHEVPVGGGVGRVRAARAHELETVAGTRRGGPRPGDADVAVVDEVDRQQGARGVPMADGERAGARPLLARQARLDVVGVERRRVRSALRRIWSFT